MHNHHFHKLSICITTTTTPINVASFQAKLAPERKTSHSDYNKARNNLAVASAGPTLRALTDPYVDNL